MQIFDGSERLSLRQDELYAVLVDLQAFAKSEFDITLVENALREHQNVRLLSHKAAARI